MEVVLPAPFTPGEHDHEGPMGVDVERLRDRPQLFEQQVRQRLLELRGLGIAFAACARAQVVDQKFGRGDAHVRREQHRFQLFVERFVELASRAEEARELTAELAARVFARPRP